MASTVDIRHAKTRLPELIERARLGGEIIIVEVGEPVARTLPERSREPRRPGSAKGVVVIQDDLDAPGISEASQIDKQVRVVSTIEYLLEPWGPSRSRRSLSNSGERRWCLFSGTQVLHLDEIHKGILVFSSISDHVHQVDRWQDDLAWRRESTREADVLLSR